MTTYIALLRKDETSDFGVDFPDFPGCVTAGGTLQEASAMAREALRGHIALMLEDGEAIPDPAPLDAVMAESENRDAMPFLVEVQTTRPKTVRVNITLPEPVLAEIDAHAAAHGFTRSGFLVHAARRAMDSIKGSLMSQYYVNKNAHANGDHDVHRMNCPTPAAEENRHYLGEFSTCHGAVAAAKLVYPQSDGCAGCLPECHTS